VALPIHNVIEHRHTGRNKIVKEAAMTTIDLRRTHSPVAIPNLGSLRTSGNLAQPAKVALVSAAAAVPPITMLHMNATAAVDPASWTISDYVVTLPYGIPLFGMTAAALAIGGGMLAHGLAQLTGTRVLRGLLAAWAIALLVAAIFPTNLRGTPENFSSTAHLYAGAVVFAALPAAGVLLARRQRRLAGRNAMTVALTLISVISALLSTALILNRLPGVIGMPEVMLPPGILQRAAGAVEIVLLAVAAVTVLPSAHRSDSKIAH
jgi:hypothetical protein